MLTHLLHNGLTVPDLERSKKFYGSLGFEVIKEFHKSDINADVAMVQKGDTTLELFEFHGSDNPQVEFIRNHIAFYSDSLEDDVEALVNAGYKITIPITEGMVFRFAYVQDEVGTNYELATQKTTS